MSHPTPMTPEVTRMRLLTLVGLVALIAWLGIESAMNAPAGTSAGTVLLVWLLQALGLAWFMPGIWRGNASSGAWLGYVLLLYFILAVLNAFAPGLHGQMALVECVLIGGVFLLAIRFVKVKRASQGGAL